MDPQSSTGRTLSGNATFGTGRHRELGRWPAYSIFSRKAYRTAQHDQDGVMSRHSRGHRYQNPAVHPGRLFGTHTHAETHAGRNSFLQRPKLFKKKEKKRDKEKKTNNKERE